MTSMRLLIALPHIGSAGGGVSEAARLLAHALYERKEFEIHVLTQHSPADTAARSDWPPVFFHAFRSYGPANFGFAPGMVWHMLRNRYDVIHVHGIWTFHVFAAAIGMLRGIPAVISPHGMLEPWILRRSPHQKNAVTRLYQGHVLCNAAFVHALTPKEEEDIRAILTEPRTITVPNFVADPQVVLNPPVWLSPELQRRRIFLFFGRIHEKKGWRQLLAAWRRLCLEDVSVRERAALVFCGWNDGNPDLEARIAEVAAETENVIFGGPQYGPDRTASYEAADFFVLPSISEGLPMAVLEAVRGGALVMMSRACNLPALLEEGAALETGSDEDTILAALRHALALTPDRMAAMRSIAERHVATHYSKEVVASAMSRALLQASSGGRRESRVSSPLPATPGNDPFKGAPSFSVRVRLVRLLWGLVWFLFASWTPPPLRRWRAFLLRVFGAQVHPTAQVYGSARIWHPRHLQMGPHACLGPKVICYNLAPIRLGEKTTVSQGAHLCAGTHNIDDPYHQLIVRPIALEDGVWVAAEAFIGPGVTVGRSAVIGARTVLFADAEPFGVYVGNPARLVRQRHLPVRDAV